MTLPVELAHGPTVTYGGFRIYYATVNLNEAVLYGEDPHVAIGTRVSAAIQGWIFIDETDETMATMGDLILLAQGVLWTPRQQLLITSGSNTMVRVDPILPLNVTEPDTAVKFGDIDYGPKPINVTINKLTDSSAAINFTVEYTKKICSDYTSTPKTKYVENSKAESWQVDVNGYLTRTVNGSASILPTFRAGDDQNIDNYRAEIIPAGIAGWRREGITWNLARDKKSTTYTVTDRELHRSVPANLTQGESFWTVTYKDFDVRPIGVLEGFLHGPKNVTKLQIIAELNALLIAKFGRGGALTATNVADLIWIERTIREDVLNNRIDFKFAAQITKKIYKNANGAMGLDVIGVLPPGWDGNTYNIPPYGVSGYQSTRYRTFDACSATIEGEDFSDNNTTISQADAIQTARESGTTGDSTDIQSSEDKEAPYINWSEYIGYDTKTNVKVFTVIQETAEQEGAVVNSKDVVQQTAHPETHIIQSGSMTRLRKPPEVPAPIVKGPILKKSVTLKDTMPTINGIMYSINYEYIIRPSDTFDYSSNAYFPDDPRTTEDLVLGDVGNIPTNDLTGESTNSISGTVGTSGGIGIGGSDGSSNSGI